LNNDEIEQHKQIAYYASILQAWQNTKMELDKNILTLSSGAIGLLVTFINTFGVKTQCEIILYIISIGAFLIAIISSLMIFNNNAKYLEKINQDSTYTNDPILGFLDKTLIITFVIGIIGTILLSIVSITNQKEGKKMSEKIIGQQSTGTTANTKSKSKSLDGMANLHPSNESFNNFANLQPKGNTEERSKPTSTTPQDNAQDKNSSDK
jgi:hypothetical protein